MTLWQNSTHNKIHTNAMWGMPNISYIMATPNLQLSNKNTEM